MEKKTPGERHKRRRMRDETEAAGTGSKRLCGGHCGAAGMAVPGAPAGRDALRPAGSLRHPPEPAVSEPVRRVGDLPVQPHGASAGAAAAAERGSVDAVLDPCAHPAVPAEHSSGAFLLAAWPVPAEKNRAAPHLCGQSCLAARVGARASGVSSEKVRLSARFSFPPEPPGCFPGSARASARC